MPTVQAPLNFVTVVALSFSVFTAFGVLGTAAQPVLGAVYLGNDMPTEFVLFAFALFVFFALDLRGSIGLLQRSPWARRYFIGFRIFNLATMALGVIGIVVMAVFFRVGAGELMILGTIVAIWVPFAALFVWIIRRLRSPAIVAEFELDVS